MWASSLSFESMKQSLEVLLLLVFVNIINIQVFVLFILYTLSIIHLRRAAERYKKHKTNSVSGNKLNTSYFCLQIRYWLQQRIIQTVLNSLFSNSP